MKWHAVALLLESAHTVYQNKWPHFNFLNRPINKTIATFWVTHFINTMKDAHSETCTIIINAFLLAVSSWYGCLGLGLHSLVISCSVLFVGHM